ncbi:DUF2274 domain-containing protein [Nitrospirillum viridazoti]|uniref:DUF2274 domain-containing protein n=1 Tax=Nitrospirillum amazonense TaxID=28077 RepID=A0A560HP11_9PROT|nr:DUF2274 domain-containing protein [Nitrospirillum amazonense]TWB48253.1 hypothetical protein FBZ92_13037 [Nitrospirillum amazonense]
MLKLAKLPDRTPVRLTVTLSPDLNQRLLGYASLYRATYGQAEEVAELIPYMLDAFLDSDRTYAKARKEDLIAVEPASRRRGRPRTSAAGTIPTDNTED